MNKKELKDAYKRLKPDMGVYAYKCRPTEKAYIGYGQDVKGDINSITFRLKLGSFVSKCGLQDDWNKYGAAGFEIEVLEPLEYDKNEMKTDYQSDLRVLREFCAEAFENFEFIQS